MRPSTRLAGVVAVVVAAVLSGPAWAAQTSQAGAIQAPRRRWRGIHRHLNGELAIKRQ